MEKYVAALLGISLISCGEINHTVKDGVDVELTINFEELEQYFDPVCRQELPNATEEEIQECVNLKIGEFLDTLSN